MKIKGKFIRSDALGKKLHHLLALDWEVEVQVNRMGEGVMVFTHPNLVSTFVEFTDFSVNDEVEITYNELGIVRRCE